MNALSPISHRAISRAQRSLLVSRQHACRFFTRVGLAVWILTCPAGASTNLFDGLHVIDIALTRDAVESLRARPRQYIRATLRIDGGTTITAGLHLKGSSGSFQPIDERPSMTVDFTRFTETGGAATWPKIHFNNAAEDPSLCAEYVGSALFRKAGIPSPQVGHARVQLNGKNLGVFVLKEAFTPQFLQRTLPPGTGALLEPEPRQDIGGSFKVQVPWQTSATQPSLKRLAQALRAPSNPEAWPEITNAVDTAQFARFMAVEVLIGHRDGYTLARNNYRVYLPTPEGRIAFLPHGMDQLFQIPNAPLFPNTAGQLAQYFLKNPSGKSAYTEALRELAPKLLSPETLNQVVDAAFGNFKQGLSLTESVRTRKSVETLRDQVLLRSRKVHELLNQKPQPPVAFSNGIAPVTGWKRVKPSTDKVIDDLVQHQGVPCLHLVGNRWQLDGFRSEVVLKPGRYRFRSSIRTRDVHAAPMGPAAGFSLRVEGTDKRSAPYAGVGESWASVAVEFEVTGTDPRLVALRCTLRSARGEAWVPLHSLELEQLPSRQP